jgi:predicted ATPase
MSPRPLLQRVVIQNYKSIAFCDVPLGPLNFLVGLNGSGKSNFVDAIRFCRDGLRKGLEQAFGEREASLASLSRNNWGNACGFGMRFDLALADGRSAHYSFSLRQGPSGPVVDREECTIASSEGRMPITFSVDSGQAQTSFGGPPAPPDGQLYLIHGAGAPEVRPVYDALSSLEFYDPEPRRMKTDSTGRPSVLDGDGGNTASVLSRIEADDGWAKFRIEDYLRRISPGIGGVEIENFQSRKYLNFVPEDIPQGRRFLANEVSDGTLRALAILIALFQRGPGSVAPSMIAIEEPETGIHPAAAGILLDSLIERSNFVQVLVTSHSADLLDSKDLPSDAILSVEMSSGGTRIGKLDAASLATLKKRLFTAGELLRMDDLHPGPSDAGDVNDPSPVFDKA